MMARFKTLVFELFLLAIFLTVVLHLVGCSAPQVHDSSVHKGEKSWAERLWDWPTGGGDVY